MAVRYATYSSSAIADIYRYFRQPSSAMILVGMDSLNSQTKFGPQASHAFRVILFVHDYVSTETVESVIREKRRDKGGMGETQIK